MDIDQRLQKLSERHLALTQTVELMAVENRQLDRRMVEIMESIICLLHAAEARENSLE